MIQSRSPISEKIAQYTIPHTLIRASNLTNQPTLVSGAIQFILIIESQLHNMI